MEPKLVTEQPPRFRVIRVVGGHEGDLEAALNDADADQKPAHILLHTQPNGDVLIVIEYTAQATQPAAEATT